jgi:hypothetical protein
MSQCIIKIIEEKDCNDFFSDLHNDAIYSIFKFCSFKTILFFSFISKKIFIKISPISNINLYRGLSNQNNIFKSNKKFDFKCNIEKGISHFFNISIKFDESTNLEIANPNILKTLKKDCINYLNIIFELQNLLKTWYDDYNLLINDPSFINILNNNNNNNKFLRCHSEYKYIDLKFLVFVDFTNVAFLFSKIKNISNDFYNVFISYNENYLIKVQKIIYEITLFSHNALLFINKFEDRYDYFLSKIHDKM